MGSSTACGSSAPPTLLLTAKRQCGAALPVARTFPTMAAVAQTALLSHDCVAGALYKLGSSSKRQIRLLWHGCTWGESLMCCLPGS